ncbi:MAG: hypothetical protein R3223_06520 [Longimicrobiales bacterium]|nr:hypothetical protein [Longimicrobiales bacterium]
MLEHFTEGLHRFARHIGRRELAQLLLLVVAAGFLAEWGEKAWALGDSWNAVLPVGTLTFGVFQSQGFAFSLGQAFLFLGGIDLASILAGAVLLVLCYRASELLHRRHVLGIVLIAAWALAHGTDLFPQREAAAFVWVSPIVVDGLETLLEMKWFVDPDVLFLAFGIALWTPVAWGRRDGVGRGRNPHGTLPAPGEDPAT